MKLAQTVNTNNLEEIVAAFNDGKIVCLPTDTVYAISCCATNFEAVERIYAIKKRDRNKPLPIFVSSVEMATYYVEFSEEALTFANRFWPGALTIVAKKKDDCDISHMAANNGKIAIRVPNNELIRDICAKLNAPIIATSANISSNPSIISSEEIKRQFSGEVDLIVKEDCVSKSNDLTPSTIVEFINDKDYIVVREGKISKTELSFNGYLS